MFSSFLPDACVRLGPALLLPPREADDNFLWSEHLHLGTYDSSGIRLGMYTCIVSLPWGRCSMTQGFSKVEGPGKGLIRVRGEASDLASDIGHLMEIHQGEYDGVEYGQHL